MSTAMLSQPTVVSMPPSLAGPPSPTKKRRRRAPATGAAEDCFTCRGKGIKCDRRRPYCGPCLEVGNDCRGYRTQLTWGVGVASRGKLRGLHLPIVNLAVDSKNTQKVVKKKSEDKSVSNGNGVKSKKSKTTEGNGRDYDNQRNTGVGKLSIITSYDFVNMEVPSSSSSRASSALSVSTAGTSPAMSAISQASMPPRLNQARKSPPTNPSAYSPYSGNQPHPQQYHSHLSPQQQQYQTPVQNYHKSPYSHVSLPPHQPTPSMLLSPMSEYEPSFPSSQHYPMSSAPSSAPLYDLVTGVSSSSYHPPNSMTVTSSGVSYAPITASIMHTSSRLMSDDHLHHNQNHHHHHNGSWNGVSGMGNLHHQHVQAGNGNLSDLLYEDEMLAVSQLEFSYNPPSYQSAHVSVPASHPSPTSIGLSSIASSFPPPPQLANIPSKLRFLIDYYDKTVCASIVSFDGPGNPYRNQILPMAFRNEALLEAIYALSTSHMESLKKASIVFERRSNASRMSPVGSLTSDSPTRSHSPSFPSSPASIHFKNSYRDSPDTFQKLPLPSAAPVIKGNYSAAFTHKNNSINLLNAQLTDPELAKSDSAMATLLILLFYHISETGVGQFKTHLAGVKKLMGMRCVGKETGIWGWMETVFTWLDNMSASLNNREAQLRGGYLDMIFESNDAWDLESLTGCDRDLFMRLAGLGRINMLSQMPANKHRGSPPYSEEDDGVTEPFRDEGDGRDEFWLAWNAIKRDLNNWRPTTIYAATPSRHNSEAPAAPKPNHLGFDDTHFSGVDPVLSPTSSSYSMSPSPPSANSPSRGKPSKAHEAVENNHWLHASNVWRYAAILYVDRLAYPHLPSSHSIFQNTVRKVLDHVNCIPNAGLNHRLLWPLFVIGTECVVDAHRDTIRERCVEMQRECGFFNKVSGLEVLEKLWDDDLIEEEEEGHLGDEMFAGAKKLGKAGQSIGGRGLRWRKVTGYENAEYLMI